MKKILFVCDGNNFSEGGFAFIRSLCEEEQVFVKGFFCASVGIEQMISISYMPTGIPFARLKEAEQKMVTESKCRFIKECESMQLKYKIHDNEEEWNSELFAKESRFADMVVISEELFGSNLSTEQPNYLMKETLHDAECPVMIVPEAFTKIERIVVAYNGSKECMYALKQLSYLLPRYNDLPTEFVYVKDEAGDDIPDMDLLQEYIQLHFASIFRSKLHVNAQKHFSAWLGIKKNALLVSGSFTRPTVSTLLKRSFANQVLHDHACPVFIAHPA